MSANGNTPLLELTEVEAALRRFSGAVQSSRLTVNRGEIVTLIGANGAGKTTTLRVISGLLRAKKGTVSFEGRISPRRRRTKSWRAASATCPRAGNCFPT